MGAPGRSWWKQGIRMTECWGCTVDDVALMNPNRTGSGEGYGVTLYGATECMVTRTRHERNRHDVLLFNGSSGNIISHGVSEDARISGPDLHGAQCNSNQFHHWTITGGPSIATNGDGGPGNKYALRIGNTTHADGDYNSLFSDIQVRNWPGPAIEVLPQSKGSIFDGIDVRDTDVGLRLRKLGRDTAGALVNTEITVKNSSFADVPTLFDVDGGATAVVHGLTFKNNDILRATSTATIKNVQGLRWHDNLWIDPLLGSAHALDLATGVTNYRVTGSDLILASSGVYDLSTGDDLPGGTRRRRYVGGRLRPRHPDAARLAGVELRPHHPRLQRRAGHDVGHRLPAQGHRQGRRLLREPHPPGRHHRPRHPHRRAELRRPLRRHRHADRRHRRPRGGLEHVRDEDHPLD
jgi:hypothetical protein